MMATQGSLIFAPEGVIDLARAPQGSSGARFLSINGVPHVAKCRQHSNGPWVCFNEYFAARAAATLQLPVPQFSTIRFQGALPQPALWFCSKRVHPGRNPDAASFGRLVNGDTLGGIAVLDFWLCNNDRSPANLYVEELAGHRERLYIIDHGHTLLTSINPAQMAAGDGGIDNQILTGCPMLAQAIANVNELGAAIERLQAVSEGEIMGWVDTTPEEWVPHAAIIPQLKDFLLERRRRMRDIIAANLGRFPNIIGGAP